MPPKVLYVEDNPDDVLLTQLAFRKAGVHLQLEVATDGEKAVAALQNGAGSPASCVLLDLKLPGISGLQVLGWIRAKSRNRRLPVIMLTSSSLPADINQAYELGANSYLVKPSDLDTLVELVRTIDHYWLRTNTPPVA